MKGFLAGIYLVIFLASSGNNLFGQQTGKFIRPDKPVVVGQPFQLQYIYWGKEKVDNLSPISIKGFRIIAGPTIYKSKTEVAKTDSTNYRNIVYTLEPLQAGSFIVPAFVSIGKDAGEQLLLEVLSASNVNSPTPKASGIPYIQLSGGGNILQKINANLFVKLDVDRKTCYIGEPVLVTYKLYSRLQSRSDIIKNPGFYGFTVNDIVSLDDKIVVQEKIHGVEFDVHTIRIAQLFPLQAGKLLIDPMEISNEITLSNDHLPGNSSQEITEGTAGTYYNRNGEQIIKTMMKTAAVEINVQALPVNSPPSYSGAVGSFSIAAKVALAQPTDTGANELIVKLSGQGNFLQIGAPSIQWPHGIEGFDANVVDSIQSTVTSVKGSRIFHFPFVSYGKGQYTIPEISFSFFQPRVGKYESISTPALNFSIDQLKQNTHVGNNRPTLEPKHGKPSFWIFLFAFLSMLAGSLFYYLKKKEDGKGKQAPAKIYEQNRLEDFLWLLNKKTLPSKDFYNGLHSVLWSFLTSRFSMYGSDVTKENLQEKMIAKKISPSLIQNTLQMLNEWECGIFTNIEFSQEHEPMLEQTRTIMQKIDAALFHNG